MARLAFTVRPYHWRKQDGTERTSWEVYGRAPSANQPIRKRFLRRMDADAYCREMNAQLRAGTLPLTTSKKDKATELTLLDWFDKFLENRKKNFKEKTFIAHQTRRGQVKHWLETSGGFDRPISQFRKEHFEELMSFLKTQPLPTQSRPARDNTINGIHQSLTAVFNYALSQQEEENEARAKRGDKPVNWVSRNPMKGVAKTKKAKSARFTAWSPGELAQIDAMIESAFQPCFRVLVNTGLRTNELRYLRWSEVNLEERIITITITDDYRPKHDMTRHIPYGEMVHEILLAQQGKNSKWVFTGKRTAHQLDTKALLHALQRAIEQTELKIKGTVVHCTRATFITNLFRTGCDLDRVMELAGHIDPRTTMGYVNTDEEGQREAVERLDVFFKR